MACQNIDYLSIGRLPEILVKIADRAEVLMYFEAEDFIGFFPHRLDRFRGANRHREDEHPWLAQPDGPQGGAGRGAGRDAIVDDDRDTAFDT